MPVNTQGWVHMTVYSRGSLYEKNVGTQGTNIGYQLKGCQI